MPGTMPGTGRLGGGALHWSGEQEQQQLNRSELPPAGCPMHRLTTRLLSRLQASIPLCTLHDFVWLTLSVHYELQSTDRVWVLSEKDLVQKYIYREHYTMCKGSTVWV